MADDIEEWYSYSKGTHFKNHARRSFDVIALNFSGVHSLDPPPNGPYTLDQVFDIIAKSNLNINLFKRYIFDLDCGSYDGATPP